jgi:predicted phage tail protein
MIHTLHLHGFMGKKYAKTVTLAADNMFQLMSGLTSRFGPGFKNDVRDGNWHLTDGAMKVGNDLGNEDVAPGRKLKSKHIHLMPAVEGASAALRIVIGVVIVAVGVYLHQPWLVAIGASLILGGVTQMLTKTPKASTADGSDQQASYIYNGAVNVDSQGGPIPIGYGRFVRASSVLIATDFSSDEIY